jgi:very-short-patch-repair endonuclease
MMSRDDMRWGVGQRLEKEKRVPSPLAGEGQDEGEMTNKVTTISARKLRRNFTDAEMKLWKHLRNRLTGGQKFRRQQPIGKYIVDFVCFEKRLIVEVDGGQQGERAAYDSERTAWLESRGFRVLRFWNNEVLQDIEIVLDLIVKELEERGSLSPSPSPI